MSFRYRPKLMSEARLSRIGRSSYLLMLMSTLSFFVALPANSSDDYNSSNQMVMELETKAPDSNSRNEADSSSQLAQMLEIPEVQKQYKDCQDAKVSVEDMDDCLWNGSTSKKIPALSKDVKKKVTEEFEASKSKTSAKYESVNLARNKTSTDPAIKQLQDYLSQRLSDALFYDDKEKNKVLQTSDKKFHELYKTQLGKNIIQTLSSFCIETNSKRLFMISNEQDERDTDREENLKGLKKIITKDKSKKLAAYSNWEGCIQNVQHHCYQPSYAVSMSGGSGEASYFEHMAKELESEGYCDDKGPDQSCAQYLSKNEDIFKENQARACQVTNYLKAAKQNIKYVDAVNKRYDEIGDNTGFKSVNNHKEYSKNTRGKTFDELTGITSGQAINESGYREAIQKKKEDFQECYNLSLDKKGNLNADDPKAKIKDEQKCKKYYLSDAKRAKESLAEVSLRSRAVEEKLKELKDKESIGEYLKEEGYSDEAIEEELKVGEEELSRRIRERYKKEREALIKSYASKIKENSIEGIKEGDKELSDEDKQKLKKKLGDVATKINSQMESHADLIHYNNIVSGYLEVGKEGSDEKSQNTAVTSREAQDYWRVTEENKKPSGLEELHKKIAETGVNLEEDSRSPSSDSESQNGELTVEQINNKIINITSEKDRGKKEKN